MALAIIVMIGSMMQGAMAQASVNCLSVTGSEAPFNDAAAAVQAVRLTGGPCCQSSATHVCSVVQTSGNAAISVCGANGYCPTCSDVGTGINEVLSQCVTPSDEVCGYFEPDGTNDSMFYITSASQPPGGPPGS